MLKRLWNNAVIRSIAALLLYESLSYLIVFLLRILGITFPESNLGEFINEIVKITIPVLIIAFSFKTISSVNDPLKGLGKSLICGSWFLLLCGAVTAGQIAESKGFKSASEILFFFLFIAAVCFSEELICRGTITEILIRRYGNSIKGKLLSIFLGSFMFSICHLSNLLRGQSLKNTILQMISVFCLAVFLNTIYVRYRNLYAMILLHAALDIMTLFEYGILEGKTLGDSYTDKSSSGLASFIICNSLYIIAAVIIFLVTNRKGGVKKCSRRSLSSSVS